MNIKLSLASEQYDELLRSVGLSCEKTNWTLYEKKDFYYFGLFLNFMGNLTNNKLSKRDYWFIKKALFVFWNSSFCQADIPRLFELKKYMEEDYKSFQKQPEDSFKYKLYRRSKDDYFDHLIKCKGYLIEVMNKLKEINLTSPLRCAPAMFGWGEEPNYKRLDFVDSPLEREPKEKYLNTLIRL